MASKAEKQLKASATVQLRTELTQASKSLQAITGSLEKLESSFTECETVLSREKALQEQNLALRKKVDELQNKQHEFQKKFDEQTVSFANSNQALFREYDRRCTETLKKYEAVKDDYQRKFKEKEQEWKQQLAAEKNVTRQEKENECKANRNIEMDLRKTLEIQKTTEAQLQKQERELSAKVTDLENKNKELKGRLTIHETVSNGKIAEVRILEGRLSSIEAFRVQKSTDEINLIIDGVRRQVRNFCINCVDNSERLPGWNQAPDALRYKNLPKVYSSESEAGRHVLIAAIQHSVCAILNAHIFLPFRAYVSHETHAVAESICRRNSSLEAIWRVITVNTLTENPSLLKPSTIAFQKVARNLVVSWQPLVGEQERDHLCRLATELFVQINATWLDLMKFEDRIYAKDEVSAAHFDSDSEEESYSPPGGFALPDSTSPVLCLFPAIFKSNKLNPSQPALLQKGTAMFRDSPPLLVALNEAEEVSSPRANHKRKMTQ